MKTKKLKCWIETHKSWSDTPIIMFRKPLNREKDNSRAFGYEIYPAEIIINLSKKL